MPFFTSMRKIPKKPSSKGIISVGDLKSILVEQLHCTEEELDFRNVTSIDLEFKSLLKITCLWPMTNLTRLNLSNNVLKRIENLDALVNLKDLDLSFNEIVRIENLRNLHKLTKLSLFCNNIEVLENLEGLSDLKIFSIGRNKIAGDVYAYFRKFRNLRSLAIRENPCYEVANAEEMFIAFTPQLIFLNYKKVTPQQQYIASCKHKAEIARLKKLQIAELQEQKRRERDSKKEYAFDGVINGNEFFEKVFANYDVMLKLGELGEDFLYLNNNLKKKFANLFSSVRDLLECNHQETKGILKKYAEDIDELESKSVLLKRTIIKRDNAKINELKNASAEHEEIADVVADLRIKLLAEECDMHNRFEKLLDKLEDDMKAKMTELIAQMNEIFDNIAQEENNYVSLMFKCIRKKLCTVGVKNILSQQEMLLFGDENPADEFAERFQNYNELLIGDTKKDFLERAKNWKVHPEFRMLEEKKVVRHRKAVLEIVKCLEILQNDEIITV